MRLSRRTFLKAVPLMLASRTMMRNLKSEAVRKEPDPCYIVFDLDPDPKNQAVLDWLKRGNYCWGIEVPWQTPEERLHWLREQGWEVILHLYAHPATRERHHAYKKWPLPDIPEILQRHLSAAKGNPEKVIWQILLEDDSAGVAHSQELLKAKPKTHAEAAAMLQRHLDETIAAARPFGNIKRWSVCGFAGTAHHFARQPEIDLVTVERANDDIEDLQTGIAFCRGAGRQYHKLWGIDLSLWWGVIYGVINDLPTAFHKRHLYVSWFSGAQHFRIEGGNLFWDRKSNKPQPIADCMDEFGQFIQKHPRGRIETPVAVMLPPDHGWITPPYWRTTNEAWNYARIPYRQGQRAIDGFFSIAFPGSNFAMQPFPFGKFESDDPPATPFALSTIAPRFAPAPEDVYDAEPPLPFGRYQSRKEAWEAFQKDQIETSHYRPMGQSRWGDIFDVLTVDADESILEQYQVLILLDQIKLDDVLLKKLTTATSKGMTLICAAGVVGPAQEEFIGAKIIPELRVGSAWKNRRGNWVNEPFQYVPVTRLQADLVLESSNGAPLVITKKQGRGKVITCLIPWFEGTPCALNGIALEMLDQVISAVQPVQIDGLPIEWLSTVAENQYCVLLSNNSDQDWEGTVTARRVNASFQKCTELRSGQSLKTHNTENGAQVRLKLAPFDVGVVAWRHE